MHKHEPQITLDGKLKCRNCGKFLDKAEKEIVRVNSMKTAKRTLDELAVAGNYCAVSYANDFIIFSRERNGVTEEMTAERLGGRNFRIVKRYLAKEVMS